MLVYHYLYHSQLTLNLPPSELRVKLVLLTQLGVGASGPLLWSLADFTSLLPEVVLPVVPGYSSVPEWVRGGFSRGLLPLWGLLLVLELHLLLLVPLVSLDGLGHVLDRIPKVLPVRRSSGGAHLASTGVR